MAAGPPATSLSSPFRETTPTVLAAAAYALATVAWVVAGEHLPGGRWLAVHVFTLGVLTNLIVAFSQHFGRTVTRAPDRSWPWQAPVLNGGIVATLVGIPTGTRWAVGLGATVVTAVVLESYRRLRHMRRRAVGARFGWIARCYERAHGAFVHGAILGLLMGLGLVSGAWYGSARLAHLHINVLGWAGLTVLATLVFFGPTMVRARIEGGADGRAARALRHGTTGLTVGALALLATGIGGSAGTALRLVAAGGLASFAWAATVVCLPVLRAARGADSTGARPAVIALCLWFPTVVWADAAVIASGDLRLLDAVGLAALLGAVGQAVVAALSYLAPLLFGRTAAARDTIRGRLERGAAARVGALNTGALLVVAAAAVGRSAGATGAAAATAGWAMVVAAVVWQALVAGWPAARRGTSTGRSGGGSTAGLPPGKAREGR